MAIIIDEPRRAAFENSIKAMADFKTAFGRGLSGDFVAELYVADELGLSVVDSLQPGYNALGPGNERYQIKFRSDQTLDVYLNNLDFDYLVLVNLNANYQLTGMWRVTTAQAQEIFAKRANSHKYQATQERVKSIGERIQMKGVAVRTAEDSPLSREITGQRWRDIRGAAAYPLTGEDAQDWVSQSRREDDAEKRRGAVTIAEALLGVNYLFLDTAPVIYFVEQNPNYTECVNDIFDRIDAGNPIIVSSSITLAETLVVPVRLGMNNLSQAFVNLLTQGQGARFVSLGSSEAQQAAELRVRYHLSLTDAFQIACALSSGCEALLTNDHQLRQVTELKIIVLDDLT